MGTAVALIVLVVAVLLVVGSKGPAKTPAAGRPQRPVPPHEPDVIGGWLLGHQIARGHDGFPGDPLPHGHLGSPANLAFWATVFDEEDDEE